MRVDGNFVVSGGTRGLGAAVVSKLAAVGASKLVFCGRDGRRGELIASEASTKFGTDVSFIPCDLSDASACIEMMQKAEKRLGRIDGIVNAAGVTSRGTILSTTVDSFDYIFAVNTRAPFLIMQCYIEHSIRENIPGSIVNIGSVASDGGQPFKAAYSSSKGALQTLTRNTAFAVMKNQIRVNLINPGWMNTDSESEIQKIYHGAQEDWKMRAGGNLPYSRLIEPEEVANLTAYLLSASSCPLTGACITLDQSIPGAFDSVPVPSNEMTRSKDMRAGCRQW